MTLRDAVCIFISWFVPGGEVGGFKLHQIFNRISNCWPRQKRFMIYLSGFASNLQLGFSKQNPPTGRTVLSPVAAGFGAMIAEQKEDCQLFLASALARHRFARWRGGCTTLQRDARIRSADSKHWSPDKVLRRLACDQPPGHPQHLRTDRCPSCNIFFDFVVSKILAALKLLGDMLPSARHVELEQVFCFQLIRALKTGLASAQFSNHPQA